MENNKWRTGKFFFCQSPDKVKPEKHFMFGTWGWKKKIPVKQREALIKMRRHHNSLMKMMNFLHIEDLKELRSSLHEAMTGKLMARSKATGMRYT